MASEASPSSSSRSTPPSDSWVIWSWIFLIGLLSLFHCLRDPHQPLTRKMLSDPSWKEQTLGLFYNYIDDPLHDFFLRSKAAPALEEAPVVILIDNESLSRLGERWPLRRATWARFIDVLSGYNPAVIGLDMWFESPEPTEEVDIALDLADQLRAGALARIPQAKRMAKQLDILGARLDGDRQLGEAMAKNGRVVLGVSCIEGAGDTLDARVELNIPQLGDQVDRDRISLVCPTLSQSTPSLVQASLAQAGIKVLPDHAQVVRRYPFLFRSGPSVYPSLAMQLYRTAYPEESVERLQEIQSIEGAHPVLQYRSTRNLTQLSFSDVMESPPGTLSLRQAIQDRIVLVGVSALGTEDYMKTPLTPQIPGVFIHADAIQNLQAGHFMVSHDPYVTKTLLGGWIMLLALAMLGRRVQKSGHLVTMTVVTSLIWIGNARSAYYEGYIIPISFILVGILGWYGLREGQIYRRGEVARKQSDEIRNAFTHYLAPEVVAELVKNPEKLTLGGQRREITAFFTDIEGFTQLSEELPPQVLTKLLNECLGAMTQIIVEEGGIVDKYIGDAIVAMFGAPVPHANHAVRAARAAMRCQAVLDSLNEEWEERGMPTLNVRIGINTGQALVGNMGSELRFDYTMIGDAVNLAARLEGVNRHYGTSILAGESTFRACNGEILMRELDCVRVKGKKQGVMIYEVIVSKRGDSRNLRQELDMFADALTYWRQRKWKQARRRFATLAEIGDPVSAVYLSRLEEYQQTPVPEDWDGIYDIPTK